MRYSTVFNNTTKTNKFNHEDDDVRSVAVVAIEATLLFIIICVAILGNLLILTAIYRFSNLRTITNVFVANLAIADLLLASLGMPFTMASSITYHWIFGDVMCKIQGVINSLFCEASILTLMSVSFERFFAIMYPMKYPSRITARTVLVILIYIWVHALVCATSTFWFSRFRFLEFEHICTVDWGFEPKYTLTFSIIFFFVPFVIMSIFYSIILKTALQQQRKIADIKVGEIQQNDNMKNSPKKSNLPQSFRQKRKEHKATIMVAIVVGTFCICWFPHVVGIYCLLVPSCKFGNAFYISTTWLAMLNSALNSTIYGLLNTSFRRAFKSIISCGRYVGENDINTFALDKSKRPQSNQ